MEICDETKNVTMITNANKDSKLFFLQNLNFDQTPNMKLLSPFWIMNIVVWDLQLWNLHHINVINNYQVYKLKELEAKFAKTQDNKAKQHFTFSSNWK